jgi:hypothetical protein
MQSSISFYCLLQLIVASNTAEYFVSINGSDSNTGTIDKPWRHVTQALQFLKPGDICSIREGKYDDFVLIKNLQGTPDRPITFRAYPGENVMFDGTTKIDGEWSVYKGSIFTTTVQQPIWQLFVDDQMQINARWPNAFWYDFSVFNDLFWAKSAKNSTYNAKYGTGVMVDNGDKDLAHSGINATNAIALLNIGSWYTFAGTVEKHEPGENSFVFDLHQVPGSISFQPEQNRYYLEDKLDLLDAPTEWFYDMATHRLYLWPDDGENPSGRDIRGKTKSYSFNITSGSRSLVFSGITFFATTLTAASGGIHDEDVHDVRFNSLQFLYPTYSQRMLGSVAYPDSTVVYYRGSLVNNSANFTFFNCTFEYGDGSNLMYRGVNGLFENNLWHHNDFSCVAQGSACGSFCSQGVKDRFIRNTVHSNGPYIGFKPGGVSSQDEEMGVSPRSLIQLNHFYDLKNLQHDGAHVQTTINAQNGTVLFQNWAHDTQKFAYRFDREQKANASWGYNGTMRANVAWNTNGIMVKGDHHTIDDNLAFDNQNGSSNNTVDLIVLGQPGQGAPGENKHTVVNNNIAQNGSSASRQGGFPLPGIHQNNVQENVREILRDPDNLDFRPKANSTILKMSIGPYGEESQKGGGVYWIPGRQYPTATTPVPPNGTTTAKCDAHLMWLAGYQATSHQIYFGTDVDAVRHATMSFPEFKKELKMPANIYDPGSLRRQVWYAWRVDVVPHSVTKGTTSNMRALMGTVWQFLCNTSD